MSHKVKFLHSSDLQLGMTRAFLGKNQERFSDARDQAIRNLAAAATEHDCEFVVLAGDIFDANDVPDEIFFQAVDSFQEFQVPVFVLPGNHDALSPDAILPRLAAEVPQVTLLSDAELHQVRPGVEVFGAPLLARYPSQEIMTRALDGKEATGATRVMVGHGQFQSYGGTKAFDIAPIEAALAAGRISYVAMGDTHSAQPIGDTGKIWFSGAPEVTDFTDPEHKSGEHNSGKALVVEISEQGDVDVKPIQIGQWSFLVYADEVRTEADVAELISQWDAIRSKKTCVIKTKIGGSLSLAQRDELQNAIEKNSYRFAAFYKSKSSPEITIIPSAAELEALNLSGYVGEVYAELLAESADDPIAAEALLQLYSLVQEQEQK